MTEEMAVAGSTRRVHVVWVAVCLVLMVGAVFGMERTRAEGYKAGRVAGACIVGHVANPSMDVASCEAAVAGR